MDSRFSEKKVEINRNFINKIWNASLFVLNQIKDSEVKSIYDVDLTLSDKWMLNELNNLVKGINIKFDKYDIGMAASDLYDFFWTKFCDWYIEISKITINQNKDSVVATLVHTLTTLLKLLHPYIPFITEKIYLEIPNHDESIMISSFPEYDERLVFENDAKIFDEIRDIIKSVRNARNELKVAENQKTKLYVEPLKEKTIVLNNIAIIEKLSKGKDVEIVSEDEIKNITDATTVVNSIAKVLISTKDLKNKDEEIKRLTEELISVESEIERANKMLSNQGFVSKAPANLIQNEKAKLDKYNKMKETLLKSLELLK